MKIVGTIVLLFCLNIWAQNVDSLRTDTLITISDSSLVAQDSLEYDSTLVSIKDSVVKVDTLYPLYQKPFYNGSSFIKHETIELLDYRYTGNLFTPLGFAFLKDKGMIGQPNDLILYGINSYNTAFFSDGILQNNRYTKFLDLNLIQSELIDSIEVLPLPRGFLYGPSNYIASVNFIERDILTPAPYTRIKYYEGPEGEAFVDGIFSSTFLNMFNLSFDISNRNFDGIYDNSDFSIWQANIKLKYFLSNSINLTGSYSLVSSDLGYFGGIDADSAAELSGNINSILYDPNFAPVVYPTLRQESKWDKFKLRGLGKFGSFNTDLSIYYSETREKYSGVPSSDDIQFYTTGVSLKQSFSASKFRLELNGVYEKRELKYYYSFFINDSTKDLGLMSSGYNISSVSPVISFFLLDSLITPSVFFKVSNIGNNSETGLGADVSIKVLSFLKFYAGISSLKYRSNFGRDLFEIAGIINLGMFSADLRYYKMTDDFPIDNSIYPTSFIIHLPDKNIGSLNGFSASINFEFWKIFLEERFNHNSYSDVFPDEKQLIKMHLQSGIFYKDILFNTNLDLKTGFVLKYFDFYSDDFESAMQVDFTLAGIIQKVAIVYFSWENLFDEQFFIVPYYPMRERGIRFGLSWELFN